MAVAKFKTIFYRTVVVDAQVSISLSVVLLQRIQVAKEPCAAVWVLRHGVPHGTLDNLIPDVVYFRICYPFTEAA